MIRWLLDRSLRHKIPLWGAVLIVITTLSVSGLLMYQAYSASKKAIVASSTALGHVLSKTLTSPLIHDDLWRAFEMVRAPLASAYQDESVQPDTITVISPRGEVVVSSDPERLPMLSKIASLEEELWPLSGPDFPIDEKEPAFVESDDSRFIYLTFPIEDRGLYLGSLVIRYPRSHLYVSFWEVAVDSAILGFAVLLVLLPVNWYWGQRMAVPLVNLASLMEGIKNRPPERFATDSYEFKDELGRMFAAYNTMVEVLEEKSALERQVVSSDRLAAIGRLTAGIAHEINNPLLGMLTAIDTMKKLDTLDERGARAFGLVERGLLQIRDTVGALLVEARSRKRWLEARDLDDVRTLLQHEVAANRVRFDFLADIPDRLPFPAGAVRQILMNLLHNAVRAAGAKEGGRVNATVSIVEGDLEIRVVNDGETLGDEQVEHLFEPFVSNHVGGNGLGLWVTYQLVSQLEGQINVDSDVQQVEFLVRLPIPADERAA